MVVYVEDEQQKALWVTLQTSTDPELEMWQCSATGSCQLLLFQEVPLQDTPPKRDCSYKNSKNIQHGIKIR